MPPITFMDCIALYLYIYIAPIAVLINRGEWLRKRRRFWAKEKDPPVK